MSKPLVGLLFLFTFAARKHHIMDKFYIRQSSADFDKIMAENNLKKAQYYEEKYKDLIDNKQKHYIIK